MTDHPDRPDPADLAATLQKHFGFSAFRTGQRQVIEALLAGHSAAAVFPTGAGKSLCYQLPALLLPGLTLVVSPLIALMKDQIDALTARGIAASRIDSTLTLDESRAVMQGVRSGATKLLYVAPERFVNERFREALQTIPVSLFAVDEAHCISEWGHNFRPDYLKLPIFARDFRAERVLALTATATQDVLADICRAFAITTDHATRTGFYRENLTLLTTPVAAGERDGHLLAALRDRPKGPAIVYVTLQRTAEAIAKRLVAAGFAARPYHAGMEDDERSGTQNWFITSPDHIVVATIAFGMGIDKADIRYVYHYNLPKSLENYSQEIGRAGRDAKPSTCELFVCLDDLNPLENFIFGDTPTPATVQGLMGEVFALGDAFDVDLNDLSSRHDVRPLVLRTLMTYLEIQGFLEGGTPYYADYQFKLLVAPETIAARFEGERRTFVEALFKHSEKSRVWYRPDLGRLAATLGSPRERIIRALDYLQDQGLAEVAAKGVRNRFRRLRKPTDLPALATSLHTLMVDRETRELRRLGQVLDLVVHDGCQAAFLGAHFAEVLGRPCGHCTWCLGGGKAQVLARRPTLAVTPEILAEAAALARTKPGVLDEPTSLTRFLCGIGSPRLGRAKLSSHPLFGRLASVPFRDVMAALRQAH